MKSRKEGRGILPASSRLPPSSTPSLNEYTAFHGMLCRPKTAQRCIDSFAKGVGLFTDQETYYRYNNNSDYHHLGKYDFNRTAFPLTVWTYYALVVCSLTGLCSLLRITNYLKAVEYEYDDEYDHNTDTKNKPLLFRKGENKSIESTELQKNPVRLPPTAIDYVIDRSIALGPLLDTTTTTATAISEHTQPQSQPKEEEDEKNQTPTQNQTQTAPNSTPTSNSHSIQLIRWFEYEFGYGGLSVMMLHFQCQHGRLHLVEVFQSDMSTVFGFVGNLLMKPLNYIKSIAAATATATQQQRQRDRSAEEETKKKET